MRQTDRGSIRATFLFSIVLFVASFALVGCGASPYIDSSVGPNDGTSQPAPTATPTIPSSIATPAPIAKKVSLHPVTATQAKAQVTAVFGDELELPSFVQSFSPVRGTLNMSALLATFEKVSKEVLSHNDAWRQCLQEAGDACVLERIAADGKQLWRRDLTQAETDALLAGYHKLALHSREIALSYVIERMMLSTHFLFELR